MKRKTKRGRKNSPVVIHIRKFTDKRKVELISTALTWAVSAGVFAIPILFSTRYSYPFEFPKIIGLFILTSIVTTLFLIQILLSRRRNIIQASIINMLIIFLFSYIVSTIFSLSPIISIAGIHGKWALGLISITCFVLISIISANTFRTKSKLNILSWCITLSGLAAAVAVILPLEIFTENAKAFEYKPSSTQGFPSYLAIFLTLVIPVTVSLLINYKKTGWSTLLAGILGIQLITIVLAGSTGSFVTLLIICTIFLYYFYGKRINFRKLATLGGITVISILIILQIPPVKNIASEKWQDSAFLTTIETSQKTLTSEWSTTLKVFKEKPITGTGPELLQNLSPMYHDYTQNNIPATYTRNVYLHLLATTGLVGFIPFALLAIVILISTFKDISRFTLAELGFVAGSVVWLIQGFYHYPTITSIVLGSVMIGVTAYATRNPSPRRNPNPPMSKTLPVIIAIFGIFLLTSVSRIEKGEFLFTQSHNLTNGDAVKQCTEAIEYNPNEPEYYKQHAHVLIDFLKLNKNKPNRENVILQIKNDYRMSIAINPWDISSYRTAVYTLKNLSMLYPTEGYSRLAIEYSKQIVKLSPNDPKNHNDLGILYSADGNYPLALAEFDKAIEIDNQFWSGYLHRADLMIKKEDYQKAKDDLTIVTDDCPNSMIVTVALKMLGLIENMD